jgi:hypothetical protein
MTIRNRIAALTKAVAALPCSNCGRSGAADPPFEVAPEYYLERLADMLPGFKRKTTPIKVDRIEEASEARRLEIWKRAWPILNYKVQKDVQFVCSGRCPLCGRFVFSENYLTSDGIRFLSYVLTVAHWRACFPEFKPPEGFVIPGTEDLFR